MTYVITSFPHYFSFSTGPELAILGPSPLWVFSWASPVNIAFRANLVFVHSSSSSLTSSQLGILNFDIVNVCSQSQLHNLQWPQFAVRNEVLCSKCRKNVTWRILKYKAFSSFLQSLSFLATVLFFYLMLF